MSSLSSSHHPLSYTLPRRARLLRFLAARIVVEFWSERRRVRLNRPLWRAALLGADISDLRAAT